MAVIEEDSIFMCYCFGSYQSISQVTPLVMNIPHVLIDIMIIIILTLLYEAGRMGELPMHNLINHNLFRTLGTCHVQTKYQLIFKCWLFCLYILYVCI